MNKITRCPCGSGQSYAVCCQPYLLSTALPQQPETLMRSRYTAYTMANADYIQQTMRHQAAIGFDVQRARAWAGRVIWIKLCVHKAWNELPTKGFVEFTATFVEDGHLQLMHELSEFKYEDGRWFYVDGSQYAVNDKRSGLMIGRNTACPCGSQLKFKQCHGAKKV